MWPDRTSTLRKAHAMTGETSPGATDLVATYLTGRSIGLRAPSLEDAGWISAWDDAPLPRTPEVGREMLRRSEQAAWGIAEHVRLMIIDLQSGDIVGSVTIERQHDRIGKIRIAVASMLGLDRREAIECDSLDLVVPWMRDELDLMILVLDIASDRTAAIARAEALGLTEAVRLRDHIQRPRGRVDLVTLESINPAWRHLLAGDTGVDDA